MIFFNCKTICGISNFSNISKLDALLNPSGVSGINFSYQIHYPPLKSALWIPRFLYRPDHPPSKCQFFLIFFSFLTVLTQFQVHFSILFNWVEGEWWSRRRRTCSFINKTFSKGSTTTIPLLGKNIGKRKRAKKKNNNHSDFGNSSSFYSSLFFFILSFFQFISFFLYYSNLSLSPSLLLGFGTFR